MELELRGEGLSLSTPQCEPREKMRADEMVESQRAVVTMPALSYLAELREQSNNRWQN